MTWRTLEWLNCRTPIGEDVIGEAERRLGVRFPDSYRECVKNCHGGYPRQSDFTFQDRDIGMVTSGIAQMLTFDVDDEENIVSTRERLASQLPAGVIPITDDGSGDFVCLDFRGGGEPEVIYWHHERAEGESITRLAGDFESFMTMLREP